MELTNDFTVDVGVDEAWAILTDVERIAPCMPGAQLQEVQGDDYLGVVRVKVGPITAEYKGKATFVERDAEAHRAVLRAEGRETRGQGNAAAVITATMVPAGSGTKVSVSTDLTVSGRVAQFGRGVMADVSSKLLGQFVDCLESTIVAGEAAGDQGESPAGDGAAAGAPAASGGAGPGEAAAGSQPPGELSSPPAAVDLVGLAGPALARRLAAPLVVLAAALFV